MKVWVVCKNDFPAAVFDNEEAANTYREAGKTANDKRPYGTPWAYYHVHEFEVRRDA